MKLTKRGFTLVELMIVIAIIGILAAALFPSLTSYLKRSRDAARAAHLKDISTAIGAYYSDRERYLPTGTGCITSGILTTSYMEAGVPRDPTLTKSNGCGQVWFYSYGSGTSANSSPQFALGAIFENDNGGNLNNGTGQVGTFFGANGNFSATGRTYFDTNVAKGNGSGYVLYK